MSEKPVIDKALELAQDVAKLIFNHSYQGQSSKIHDLLLFGPTLNEEAHLLIS